MTSRERIVAAWSGGAQDHIPLTTWCFGLPAPVALRWERGGRPVRFWYSKRMEHIHTLPEPWELEDDFRRALAWRSLGVDDVLEVSIPWSMAPEVRVRDSRESGDPGSEASSGGASRNGGAMVLVREYDTPAGTVRHAVRHSGEEQGAGWVVQPDHVPLIEDFNVPRAVEHPVSSGADVGRIGFLYGPPDQGARAWFAGRIEAVGRFAAEEGFAVQAWSAFGMDAVVWFTGVQNAILMALDEPEAFGRLVDTIAATDLARSELAAADPRVDLIVQRGWYSSTDFWSPALLDQFLFPRLRELAEAVHRHGKKLAYVMTTGIETLGERLADSGVDVLYFVDPIDPIQKELSLERVRERLGGRMTLVGGISTLTLASRRPEEIDRFVERAVEVLGSTGRFILHPVDALFPDTPWEGVERLIEAWRACRGD